MPRLNLRHASHTLDNVPFVSLVAGVARLRLCLRLIESTKSGDSGYDSVNRKHKVTCLYRRRLKEIYGSDARVLSSGDRVL